MSFNKLDTESNNKRKERTKAYVLTSDYKSVYSQMWHCIVE